MSQKLEGAFTRYMGFYSTEEQMKTGVADMDPDRTQKVEQLGFEW
jgi:hypothetical protein